MGKFVFFFIFFLSIPCFAEVNSNRNRIDFYEDVVLEGKLEFRLNFDASSDGKLYYSFSDLGVLSKNDVCDYKINVKLVAYSRYGPQYDNGREVYEFSRDVKNIKTKEKYLLADIKNVLKKTEGNNDLFETDIIIGITKKCDEKDSPNRVVLSCIINEEDYEGLSPRGFTCIGDDESEFDLYKGTKNRYSGNTIKLLKSISLLDGSDIELSIDINTLINFSLEKKGGLQGKSCNHRLTVLLKNKVDEVVLKLVHRFNGMDERKYFFIDGLDTNLIATEYYIGSFCNSNEMVNFCKINRFGENRCINSSDDRKYFDSNFLDESSDEVGIFRYLENVQKLEEKNVSEDLRNFYGAIGKAFLGIELNVNRLKRKEISEVDLISEVNFSFDELNSLMKEIEIYSSNVNSIRALLLNEGNLLKDNMVNYVALGLIGQSTADAIKVRVISLSKLLENIPANVSSGGNICGYEFRYEELSGKDKARAKDNKVHCPSRCPTAYISDGMSEVSASGAC